jgi:hypothetical protein
VEQPSLGGSQRDACRFGGFPHRAFLELNLNYDPEGRPQPLNGFLQHGLFFALGVTPFRIRPMVGYFIEQAIRAKIVVTVRGNL